MMFSHRITNNTVSEEEEEEEEESRVQAGYTNFMCVSLHLFFFFFKTNYYYYYYYYFLSFLKCYLFIFYTFVRV